MMSRVNSWKSIDPKALIGSGCLWAWFDAGFMGSFSIGQGLSGEFLEIATWIGSLLQIALCVGILLKTRVFSVAIRQRRLIFAIGVCGTLGSLLSIVSSALSSPVLCILGQLLRSLFVTFAIMAWGAIYCHDGSRSAKVYVTGGFALAFVCDLVLLLMVPVVSSVAFACLPFASMALFACVDEDRRTYPPSRPVEELAGREPRGLLARYVGISFPTVGALMLVMVGFGYTQCGVTLEASDALGGAIGPVAVQLARGVVSVVLFLVVLWAPSKMDFVSRAGLLVFIAGFSVTTFLSGAEGLWIPGTIVLGGYATIDVLIWVITAQAAFSHSKDPLRTVCFMRILVNSTCTTLGRILGLVVLSADHDSSLAVPVMSFLGYLMTAAAVLLLSGRELWELFRTSPTENGPSAVDVHARRIEQLAEEHSITQREREILSLLAVGRTKPWIAKSLSISESTVNTHVRSLYAKLGVKNRQELLDLII